MVNLDLFAPILSRPWAISAHHFEAVRSRMRAALEASPVGFFDVSDLVTPRAGMKIDEFTGDARISIQGALADKAPPIWEKLGQTDYRSIQSEVAQAIAAGADSITLAIDSPGGTLAGLEETADAIGRASEAGIPVVASCDGMACSAAYWLASSAEHIHATPSAEVGNIGVVLAFADDTAFWEGMGVEFHVLTNEGADLKGTFREPLSDSQRAFLQEGIDQHGAAFRNHVQGNRPAIDPEVFRAGWYSGERAVSLGLVDSISTN